MAAYHDPRREVEKLRSHLALHDKPIGFLIGAGGSSAVTDMAGDVLIPAVEALTERCKHAVTELGDPFPAVYQALEDEFEDDSPPNVEDILSSVRRKVAAMAVGDRLAGTDRPVLEKIEVTLRRTIAVEAMPSE
ncbi:MAG: hypothetical protein DWP92_03905, partial [Armatimonadetes bacterium]